MCSSICDKFLAFVRYSTPVKYVAHCITLSDLLMAGLGKLMLCFLDS